MITKVFAVQCKTEDVSRFVVSVLTAEESLHCIPVEPSGRIRSTKRGRVDVSVLK